MSRVTLNRLPCTTNVTVPLLTTSIIAVFHVSIHRGTQPVQKDVVVHFKRSDLYLIFRIENIKIHSIFAIQNQIQFVYEQKMRMSAVSACSVNEDCYS